MARWLLRKHLGEYNWHPSALCVHPSDVPNSIIKKLPPFWGRAMDFWKQAQGRTVPLDETWHPLEVLSLPLVGTNATRSWCPDGTRTCGYYKKWRENGAHTLGDVMEWCATRRAYVSRDTVAARTVTKDLLRGRLWITDPATERLRVLTRTPTTGQPLLPVTKLRVIGATLPEYSVKAGRIFFMGERTVTPRLHRWTSRSAEWQPSETSMLPWKEVFSPRIEPKHQSLLWLMQHGAVVTACQMAQWRPDTSPHCPVCERSAETLRHYFFECPRIRDYWQLVGEFLDRIQWPAVTSDPRPVTLADVLDGLVRWKGRLPGSQVFHAEAVWQVYRAHAESTQDNSVLMPLALFARWQHAMQSRILNDMHSARRRNKLDQFTKVWTRTRCQWFVFEPGPPDQTASKVVFDSRLSVQSSATSQREPVQPRIS